MFFRLIAVTDHPCCKMQEMVESFFEKSILTNQFSFDIFPAWFKPTLENKKCTLGNKFSVVHSLLHTQGVTVEIRQKIHEHFCLANKIESLCNGLQFSNNVIDWESDLGKAIDDLMSSLYDSLDLAVFRRDGQISQPTHQLYNEFIENNKYVCPFCGLGRYKNKNGARREDFDHYLHKSGYQLAAANIKNLVPTCGTCNQDYKKNKDILANGSAFYPYSEVPEVMLEVVCQTYPEPGDFNDHGNWVVKLNLVTPSEDAIPKVSAWDRVYSIKKRLEDEIHEFFEDWMQQLSDDPPYPVEQDEFIELITSARDAATKSSKRRMEPGQIVKAAFYDFMVSRADKTFVESFRLSRNHISA